MIKKTLNIAFLLVMLFPISGFCNDSDVVTDNADYIETENSSIEEEIWDPIEPVNRGIFEFNDTLDVHVLEPVAQAYDDNIPDPIKTGIGNFFENLRYPSYLVSDILQLNFTQAAHHTGRFVVNSTVGLAGLIDVAKDIGLKKIKEDFGLTLAHYDVPPGPYIVIPFLGPSNLRDGFGRIVDGFLDPIGWIAYTDASTDAKFWIPAGAIVVNAIDQRADLLEAVKAGKESSLDFYLFSQGAYYQYREGLLKGEDSKPMEGSSTENSEIDLSETPPSPE